MNLAALDEKQKHNEPAEQLYAKALQVLGDQPEAARALIHLGLAAIAKKDFPQAMDYFQHARRVDPAHGGTATMWMAVAEQRQQHVDEAERLYQSALSLEDSKSVEAAVTMEVYGRFLREQGHADQAGELETRAAAIQQAHETPPASHPSAATYTMKRADVKAPSLVHKEEPEYSEEARAAGLQGTVIVQVVIGLDGLAHDARIVKGLGLGLDEAGHRNHRPVAVQARCQGRPARAGVGYHRGELAPPVTACAVRPILGLALAIALTGCAARKVRVAPGTIDPADYIDLEPGWRLRVVTPVLKSGGYRVQPATEQVSGNNITLATGGDFLGYEVAYYAVNPRGAALVRTEVRTGVRIEFLSAEITKEGKTFVQSRPVAALFRLPRSARSVRLIFLTRISRQDHDMAVIAAADPDDLNTLTRRVLADPSGACTNKGRTYCAWIPQGIAVTPERRSTIDKVEQWIPAR